MFHGSESNQKLVVQSVPFFIPLEDRFKVFHNYISEKKRSIHGSYRTRSVDVIIKRESLFEDGYDRLHGMSETKFLGRLRVSFVNASGLEEAGIDGGGLFK